MNNEICNEKVNVPCGKCLNDKDYITSLNTTLKSLIKSYSISITEASNEKIFNIYRDILDSIIELQRETFNLMFKYGWYCLEKSEVEKINKKYDTLLQQKQELDK